MNEAPALSRRSVLFAAAAAALSAPARGAPQTRRTTSGEENGAWRPRADMPFAVQEIYPARFERGGRALIVNAGGLAIGPAAPVRIAATLYDPVADAWRIGAPLPEARHHIALADTGAALHAVGGYARTGLKLWAMQAQNWRIEDPAACVWETARPLPAPQAEATTLVHDGRIHVIGGRSPEGASNRDWSDQGDVGAHHAYDPARDRWDALAPLPTPRNSAAGAVLGGALYVVSGRTVKGGNTPSCHAYDPQADQWRPIAPLPAPTRQRAPRGQGGLAAAAFGARLYAFGGEWFAGPGYGDGGVDADAWEYDPGKDAWRPVAAMTRPRHGLGAVALDDGIYALGGATRAGGDGVTGFVDRFAI